MDEIATCGENIVDLEYSLNETMEGGVDMGNGYQNADESLDRIEGLKRELSNLREIIRMLKMMDK